MYTCIMRKTYQNACSDRFLYICIAFLIRLGVGYNIWELNLVLLCYHLFFFFFFVFHLAHLNMKWQNFCHFITQKNNQKSIFLILIYPTPNMLYFFYSLLIIWVQKHLIRSSISFIFIAVWYRYPQVQGF